MTGVGGVNSSGSVRELLSDRFRCPEGLLADFEVSEDLSQSSGFFRLGNLVCYGQCSSGLPVRNVTSTLHDASAHISSNAESICLPFDPLRVVNNLCCERYLPNPALNSGLGQAVRSLYYLLRPMLPVSVRKHLQRQYLRRWHKIPFPQWPVDRTVEDFFDRLLVASMKSRKIRRIPFVWFWPEGARSFAMITHDVETSEGVDFCSELMDINDAFEIKSSFQVVPEERYRVSEEFLEGIRRRGFEVNVQDLNHDGNLFNNRAEFLRRVERINSYARKWDALGFRSAILYRNEDWFDSLDFSYDMSIPNVAHLDPQRGGCCTVLPFFVGKMLELPVTTTQDYSLFHVLDDYSMQLWNNQISMIREKHGLISMIIHPDYIIAEEPRRTYLDLLKNLCELRSQGEINIALPGEIAAWWRIRSKLEIERVGGSWRIRGEGSERARIAYAVLDDDKLTYEIERG
jgi:hypothetical protein